MEDGHPSRPYNLSPGSWVNDELMGW
uniref:Uncharacterized protein n=1 Tax=Musa acuminata subsp. malaccensis TaxID=214687 RepID=A0A804I1S2_MUSAM